MITFLAWISISALCAAASSAQAGPWARGAGKAFVSASASATWPDQRALELPDIYGSTYLEHGLTDRLTMGLDVGSSDATRRDRLKAVGFLRYTLSSPEARHQFALDLGGGSALETSVIRFGTSYGIGFTSFQRNSWMTLDMHGLRKTTSNERSFTLDATYGVSLQNGKIMAQISAYRDFSRAQSLSITPSYAHDLGKNRHLEIGATLGLRGKPDPALKIGIWQEF